MKILLKQKLYFVYEHNIDMTLKVIMLVKVCQIGSQNSIFCYFEREKQNQTKYVSIKMLPNEIMGKNLHCINSANFSSTTEATLLMLLYTGSRPSGMALDRESFTC